MDTAELTEGFATYLRNIAAKATEERMGRHVKLTRESLQDPIIHAAVRKVINEGHTVVMWDSKYYRHPAIDIYPDGVRVNGRFYTPARKRVIIAPWKVAGIS